MPWSLWEASANSESERAPIQGRKENCPSPPPVDVPAAHQPVLRKVDPSPDSVGLPTRPFSDPGMCDVCVRGVLHRCFSHCGNAANLNIPDETNSVC